MALGSPGILSICMRTAAAIVDEPVDVPERGPNRIRDAASAKAPLRRLVEFGWLVTEDGSRYHVTSTALSAFGEERQRSA